MSLGVTGLGDAPRPTVNTHRACKQRVGNMENRCSNSKARLKLQVPSDIVLDDFTGPCMFVVNQRMCFFMD